MKKLPFLLTALFLVQIVALSGPKLPDLKNPYEGNEQAIKEGRKLWFKYGCNGCHGGGGGGGMCPPVINDIWVYGDSDAVLYELIKLGSVELRKKYGLQRIGKERIVGDMPPFSVLSDEEIWKLITYMRSRIPKEKD